MCTEVTHHFSVPTSCSVEKLVLGPKMTKNGSSLSVAVSYTVGKPMDRRFQKVKKKRSIPPISCPAQKLVHGPNTVGKPIERRFEIFQKLNYPTHFLPHPKIVLRP